MPDTHELKTINPFFTDVWDGAKNFELRKFDPDFKVEDLVVLKEYDPNSELFSGRSIFARIRYILNGYVKVAGLSKLSQDARIARVDDR